MDENKNQNTEQNQGLSGFDSVSPANGKNNDTFNPTPMFSGINDQQSGYTVTPNGNYYTNPPANPSGNGATPTTPPAPKVTPPAPPVTPPPVTPAKQVETKPSDFIPNGTYSYSKDDLKERAVTDTPPSAPTAATPTPPQAAPIKTPPYTPAPVPPKKPKKEKKYGAGVIVTSAILAAVIGAFAGVSSTLVMGGLTAKNTSSDGNSSVYTDSTQNVTNITVDETVNSTIEAVAKKAGPSIVGIRTTAAVTNFFGGSSESTGEGSGIIYSKDGYIITNYHVIQSAVESSNAKVEVFLPEDTATALSATVVGYNIASDLAVVKIAGSNLPAIEFADSDKLSVGQYAIAIGNPGGLEFIGSVSSGIISGLNRSVTVDTGNTMTLIQTDAAINPGNSGGALVDIKGQLIGVNSIKLVSTGYEGMGFAIPSNTVKEICDNIIAKQNTPTPYIGIEISTKYTAEQLKALGYPAGAVVVSVVEGGPADQSSIKRGDIITEFNGAAINNYKDLENAISNCSPGDNVSVTVYRGGRFYSANIIVKANN